MTQSLSQYFFGNSLVNFAGGNAYTNVPYWINQIAEHAGHSYAANGGYGFLQQFADRTSPADEWGFEGVEGIWNSDTDGWWVPEYDQVVITPANFIQDVSPDTNYAFQDRSPLDCMLDIVAQVMAEQPDAEIIIYEGWADMGTFFETVPGNMSDLSAYFTFNQEAYHDWYASMLEAVNTAQPNAHVTLIPVAPILAELLTDSALSALTPADLFVDSAPHGTETLYFLASLITYTSLYNEPVPVDFPVPASIHSAISGNMAYLSGLIDTLVDTYSFEDIYGAGGGDETDDPMSFIGTGGHDAFTGGSGNDTAIGDKRNDTLDGGDGHDSLDGGKHHDVLTGGKGNDELWGRQGQDTVLGGDGEDIVDGGNGRDVVDGGSGDDTVHGGGGSDTITGGAGQDLVQGGGGNDFITGGDASDDTLAGNNGDDVFIFVDGDGHDTVLDFLHGDNRIDLSDFGEIAFADLLDMVEVNDGSITINLGRNAQLTLENVTIDQLEESDFIF
jgi:hypothetical protein